MSQLAEALCLTIQGNGQNYSHVLADGESILIGSDPHCRIRIPDASVPERQCLLQFMQGEICIHDWTPEHPTTVNGEPCDPSVPLKPGDRVAFGPFSMSFGVGVPTVEKEKPEEDSLELQKESNDAVPDEPIQPEQPEQPTVALASGTVDEPPREAAALDSYESDDDGWGALEETPTLPPLPQDVTIEESTIALLTAEIEALQAELSEKNVLLAEGSTTMAAASLEDNPSEIELRIDRLVSELEQGDQRVGAVEEALRLSEETRHAELEEKRQLEQWVGDIEDRVAARELEVTAECDVLRRKLDDATKERQEAEGQVTTLIGDSAGDEVLQDMVNVLRRENETIRTKNVEATEQIAALEKQLAQLRHDATDEAIQNRINEALRVERLELAQERAALSRKQLELTAKSNELEQKLERKSTNVADDRFRVFREQLKELHHQEQKEYVAPTITQRLANLWQRLDGPTDTD